MKQRMLSLLNRLRKSFRWKYLLGILAGAAGGYIYYRTVGCSTGACPLKSNPWLMTAWGALAGYLLFSLIPEKKKKIPGNQGPAGEGNPQN